MRPLRAKKPCSAARAWSLPWATLPGWASRHPKAASSLGEFGLTASHRQRDPERNQWCLKTSGSGSGHRPHLEFGGLKLPDHEGVAGAQLVEGQGEGGPVGAGAAGGLSEHPVAAGGLQRVDLELGLLVDGGDAA